MHLNAEISLKCVRTQDNIKWRSLTCWRNFDQEVSKTPTVKCSPPLQSEIKLLLLHEMWHQTSVSQILHLNLFNTCNKKYHEFCTILILLLDITKMNDLRFVVVHQKVSVSCFKKTCCHCKEQYIIIILL